MDHRHHKVGGVCAQQLLQLVDAVRDLDGEADALDWLGFWKLFDQATGGEFVLAGEAKERVLVDLYETHVLPMARKSFDAAGQPGRANRFQWPLALALALWILDLGTSSAGSWTERRRDESTPVLARAAGR